MPTLPLSPERLAEIRRQFSPETFPIFKANTVWRETEMVARDLLAELDYRQEQTRQVLQELLSDEHLFNVNDFKAGINHERKLQNKAIRLAAQKLGIPLES